MTHDINISRFGATPPFRFPPSRAHCAPIPQKKLQTWFCHTQQMKLKTFHLWLCKKKKKGPPEQPTNCFHGFPHERSVYTRGSRSHFVREKKRNDITSAVFQLTFPQPASFPLILATAPKDFIPQTNYATLNSRRNMSDKRKTTSRRVTPRLG